MCTECAEPVARGYHFALVHLWAAQGSLLLTPVNLHPTGDAQDAAWAVLVCVTHPTSSGFWEEGELVCLSLIIIDLLLPNWALNLDSLGCRQEIWGRELQEVYH